MAPIVRSVAWLAAQLALLPGVRAIVWHPARCWSPAPQFRSLILSWLAGGPFPMFSLAALATGPDGGMVSEGLALFMGQELRLAAGLGGDDAACAKVALRLSHWLIGHGCLTQPEIVTDPEGHHWSLTPDPDHRFVIVEKD